VRTLSALQKTVLSAPCQHSFFVYKAYSNLWNVRIACPDSAGRPLSATGIQKMSRERYGLGVQTDKQTKFIYRYKYIMNVGFQIEKQTIIMFLFPRN